jgi:hypothetical protein
MFSLGVRDQVARLYKIIVLYILIFRLLGETQEDRRFRTVVSLQYTQGIVAYRTSCRNPPPQKKNSNHCVYQRILQNIIRYNEELYFVIHFEICNIYVCYLY